MLHKYLHLSSRALLNMGLAIGIWALLGCLDAAETYMKLAAVDKACPWYRALGQGLSLWLVWALLAQPIALLVHYFPYDQRRWLSSLLVYLFAGAVTSVLKMVMDYPIIDAWSCYGPPGVMFFSQFMKLAFAGYFLRYLLIFWAIASICHARSYYRQSHEREQRAIALAERLTQAQLDLLRAQLHPHFLFNTLNAISALIHRDTEMADRMLARLGDLLRLTLDNAGTQEVALRKELEFIRTYIEIEQVRFGPRMEVTIDVDPSVLDHPVPYLVLQPIVENAIKHGIGATGEVGTINIMALRREDCLRLEVCDDGPGLTRKPNGQRIGIGLANTRARLEQLYGVDYRLELTNRETGGVRAVIEVPLAGDHKTGSDSDLLLPQFSDVP